MTRGISRREFFKVGVAGATTAVLTGCASPRRYVTLEPYVRPPEEQPTGVATWYASTCRMCPAGCGIIVRVLNGRAVKIEGNPEHPLNRGKLCARGQTGLQLLYHPDRLQTPVRKGSRQARGFSAISWDDGVATFSQQVQGAGSGLAVWLGSNTPGHLYDLFATLARALGAPAPVVSDLNSALQHMPALAAGGQGLPGFALSAADAIFSFNSDFLAHGPSSTRLGVEYGAFRSQGFGLRGALVQFEPRMSMTGAKSDYWIPIRPGTEAMAAQALAGIMAAENLGGADKVARARTVAGGINVNAALTAADVPAEKMLQAARVLAAAQRPLALPPTGVLGQEADTATTALIRSLAAIAGAAPAGASPTLVSSAAVTGMNAMPASAVADVRGLIDRMRSGQVRLLLVHSANPAYELPQQMGFREAVAQVPYVISFAALPDETAALADLVLPDRTYLESWGYQVVTPNYGLPTVSGQQPVVSPLYDARSTADIVLAAAKGSPAAAGALPQIDEVAYIRDAIGKLPAGAFGAGGPDLQWARFQQHGGWWPAPGAPGAAAAASTAPTAAAQPVPFAGDSNEFPYFLHVYAPVLTGDGRGAAMPWLIGSPDPMTTIAWQFWIEMHPQTAEKLGIKQGDIVRLTSPSGTLEGGVYLYPAVRLDTIAVPLGQGHGELGRYARGRGASAISLLGSAPDANSLWGQTRVKIERTGQKMQMAVFESTEGMEKGFINKEFPGQ